MGMIKEMNRISKVNKYGWIETMYMNYDHESRTSIQFLMIDTNRSGVNQK